MKKEGGGFPFPEVILEPEVKEIFENFKTSERFKVAYSGMEKRFKRTPPKDREELKVFNQGFAGLVFEELVYFGADYWLSDYLNQDSVLLSPTETRKWYRSHPLAKGQITTGAQRAVKGVTVFDGLIATRNKPYKITGFLEYTLATERPSKFEHMYNVYEKEKALPQVSEDARLFFVIPKFRSRVAAGSLGTVNKIYRALLNINNNLVIGSEGDVVFVQLPFTSKEFPRLTRQYGLMSPAENRGLRTI